MGKFLLFVLSGISILLFQNCSNPGTQFVNAESSASLNSCNPDLTTVTRATKLLFLVDTSGSNATSKKNIGTDDNKTWRLEVLNSFANDLAANSNVYFSLVSFQNDSATSLINSAGQAVFSNNTSSVASAITSFSQISDDGDTPYQASFDKAKALISKDLKSSSAASYVIIMLTDGEPSDYQDSQGNTDNAAIIRDVQALVALAPGQITFNTLYYYNQRVGINSSAFSRLQAMAAAGGGLAQVADTSTDLDIYKNIQLPSQSCQ